MKKEIKSLDFEIDARSAIPVYEQVKQEIKLLIMSNYLEEGDQLVPIRELATKLKINPNTIVKVYYQLDVEGYIYSLPGSGYFVKYDRRESLDEKQKIFDSITEDYISKSLKLGYSIKEMADKLRDKETETKPIKKQRRKKVEH
jgi:GntR family transcriptional regulator